MAWILDGNYMHFLHVFNLEEMKGSAREIFFFFFFTQYFLLEIKNRWVGITATNFKGAI